MKTKINFHRPLKALLVAGLLAGTTVAFNAKATDIQWAPSVTYYDALNNPYAYFNDAANWSLAVLPSFLYTNTIDGTTQTERVMDNSTLVTCVITNDFELFQTMIGSGGGGNVVLSNANVKTGWGTYGGGYQWTGVGFPNGPSTLTIGPGASFACGDHLWVGQGTANPGDVIIDGGTLYVRGQLGVGWNGTGGTNSITLKNGGRAYLNTWAGSTLGLPGNNSLGIMNLASNNCFVVITNNQTGYFHTLVTNNQLVAYGGAGVISWAYDPVKNLTTISAAPPTNQYTPHITQPTNVVTSLGSTVTFHVGVANPPVSYQWLFNGNPLSDGNGISGATTATLTVSGVTSANVGGYSVKVTSTAQLDQMVTSITAGLNTTGLNLYPVITILGVPGNTYVTSYADTVSGTYTPFATNTLNSFAPFYLVDTATPMSVKRFYKTVQQ